MTELNIEEQGVVVIEDFTFNREIPETKKEYHPLMYQWSSAEVGIVVVEGVEFIVKLIELRAGDYSIIHKFENRKGIIGFCYLDDWSFENGGYLGINYEAIFPQQNQLILFKEPIQWSIKRLNYHEKKTLKILVFHSTS